MPTLTPQQAIVLLKQQQYAPVYFLQGEETYYIDYITNYIQQHSIPANEKTFNCHVLYGKETTIGHVISQAQQYPFLGERQVILVKEGQDMADFQTEKQVLINYLQRPNLTTLLVIAYKHKTLPTGSSLATLLAEKATLIHAKPLYDNQIPAWLRQYATDKGFSLTLEAAHQLQALTGNTLTRLANELDKVMINLQPGDTITDVHIQSYVGFNKPFNPYALQKAIAERNSYNAYQLILQITDRTAILPLLGLLCNFFTKLLLVQHSPHATPQQLAHILQVNSYFVAQYIQAAQQYSTTQVMQHIRHLQEADKQAKGIGYNASNEIAILKELVYKLLH